MSRRTQIGGLSFLLSLFWAAGLFAAFVGGKVGQHPSAPITLRVASLIGTARPTVNQIAAGSL